MNKAMTMVGGRRPKDIQLPTGMFIDGRYVEATGGRRLETIDPATGLPFADFPAGTRDDVDRAVASSKSALKGAWRKTLPVERARTLMRTAALIRRDAERLSTIETLDSGKPFGESQRDIETAKKRFAQLSRGAK